MANDAPQHPDVVHTVLQVIAAVFSWSVLMAIGVILSGKFLAKRVSVGFGPSDRFSINLLILKIGAHGDEVALGFASFWIALFLVMALGGSDLYRYFVERSGIDIGQWNSLCLIASFLAVIWSIIVWVLGFIPNRVPLITAEERRDQIVLLTEISAEQEADETTNG